jgi:hypothetical protein
LADGHEFSRFRFEGCWAILGGYRIKCMHQNIFTELS